MLHNSDQKLIKDGNNFFYWYSLATLFKAIRECVHNSWQFSRLERLYSKFDSEAIHVVLLRMFSLTFNLITLDTI